MITIITEKPSVAMEIGKVIGATRRADGYIFNDTYRVTWAAGHLLEEYCEEDSGEWKMENLPVLPDRFRHRVRRKNGKPDRDAEKQLGIIRRLLDSSEYIINAGDAGREGELIQRNIYDYCGYRRRVMRLWISSLTRASIEKGFRELHEGSEFDNLFRAARARSQADWMVGINATRSLTLCADAGRTLSLGRVQSPTLAMIVRRYKQFREFTPEPFKILRVKVRHDGMEVILSSGRYMDPAKAEADLQAIRSAGHVQVETCEEKTEITAAPLLHDITSLQQEAARRYRLSAKDTLDIAQFLYESKFLTYPRTGSRFIPEDVFATVPELLRAHAAEDDDYRTIAGEILAGPLNRRSVNDTKITDHHALLVTENIPTELSDDQWAVYCLVLERMLEAFSPDCISYRRDMTAQCGEIALKAHGSIVGTPGWKAVRNLKDKDEEAQSLPHVEPGVRLEAEEVYSTDGETKPRPLYTVASLLEDMKNPAKDVDDESLRKRLADVGLGTPATRAGIIDTLYDRGYVENDGNRIVPTSLGVSVFLAIDGLDIADPVWTGKWENALAYVEEGRMSEEKFNREIRAYATNIVDLFKDTDIRRNIRYALSSETLRCPSCGKTVRVVEDKAYCKACGLMIWRRQAGKMLTDGQLRQLLEGGETELIKGFTSKDGRKFNAVLRREQDGKIRYIYKD